VSQKKNNTLYFDLITSAKCRTIFKFFSLLDPRGNCR